MRAAARAARIVRIQIDGKSIGAIRVAWNSTERQRVLAASKLPGVLSRLRASGVAAAIYSGATYNILTKLSASRALAKLKVGGLTSRRGLKQGVKLSPFRGLGIPAVIRGRRVL